MYERMKHAHDQRAWVKMADDLIPAMLERAANEQQRAAKMYAVQQEYPFLIGFAADAYTNARGALFMAIYYNAMREINR